MKLPINIFTIVILLLIECLSLSSCNVITQKNTPNIISAYDIPFVNAESRWSQVELMEADNYGRELYSVVSNGDDVNNVFSDFNNDGLANSPVNVYLICQKRDDAYVYCYEGENYIYVSSLYNNDEIIKQFKNRNDWNKPIKENNLTKFPVELNVVKNYKLYEIEQKVISDFEKELGYEVHDYYIDVIFSVQKEPIYVIRIIKEWANEEHSNVFGASYVFAYGENQEEIDFAELTGSVNTWPYQIVNFKSLIERSR